MTIPRVILMSGTPASGKDTISAALMALSPQFSHFKKHKIGTGGKLDDSYILVSKEQFDSMAQDQQFIQYHYRYDRGYGVARSELERCWAQGKTPIIHVGKYENIAMFSDSGIDIFSILLLSSREQSEQRLCARHPGDPEEVQARLKAYDEERAELAALILNGSALRFDIMIENSQSKSSAIAALIQRALPLAP
jgi:guanylate kinase